jgi:hypothetical protein
VGQHLLIPKSGKTPSSVQSSHIKKRVLTPKKPHVTAKTSKHTTQVVSEPIPTVTTPAASTPPTTVATPNTPNTPTKPVETTKPVKTTTQSATVNTAPTTGKVSGLNYPSANAKPVATFHTVQNGETLESIAAAYHLTTHDIAIWNGIAKPYTVSAGKKLLIVPP